jgi:hypothetical protein
VAVVLDPHRLSGTISSPQVFQFAFDDVNAGIQKAGG